MLLAVFFAFPAYAQENGRIVPGGSAEVQLSFAPLVKKVSPAVVNIYTKRLVTAKASNPFMDDPLFAPFFRNGQGGRMRQQVERALGSGAIVEQDGLIITNAHVVQEAEEITVVLSDGREFDAQLVLKDTPSDLALLRVDAKGEKLPFVTLKPSESLEVGDLVLAIGNPFGVGQTVTSGIVSALARSSLNINDFNFFIQTDAAINPGNSGGPLVAMDGSVVGINSAIYSRDGGSLGIGFAIPSEMVASVITAGKAGAGDKGIVRPWLGVTAQMVTTDVADSLGLDRPRGALILSLHSASPLAKAGIKVSDVAVSINGKDIHDPSEMKFRMATVPIGGKATVEIMRQGQRMTFEVEAIAPPDVPARKETTITGNSPLTGVVIANINPAVAVELGILGETEEGVIVTDVKQNASGFRIVSPGDILVQINDTKIKMVDDVRKAVAKANGQGFALIISRQGQTRKIFVR